MNITLTPTDRPTQWILRARGERTNEYALMSLRLGDMADWEPESQGSMTRSIVETVTRVNAGLPPNTRLFLRGLWWDDKRGGVRIWCSVHVLHGLPAGITTDSLAAAMGHDDAIHGGQSTTVEVAVHAVNFNGDGYEPFPEREYETVKRHLGWRS